MSRIIGKSFESKPVKQGKRNEFKAIDDIKVKVEEPTKLDEKVEETKTDKVEEPTKE